jgi:hypothetical protein
MIDHEPRWWASLAVDLATLLLPAGQVRRRYRAELSSEQYGMTRRQQAVHAVSIIAGARGLRGALVASGELTVPHSTLWCRLRLHHQWHGVITPDGGRYRHCRACGLDDDGTLNQSFDGWYQSNVRPSNQS